MWTLDLGPKPTFLPSNQNFRIMEKKEIIIGLGTSAVILGLFLLLAVGKIKSYDRVVSVRGLCEREVMADRAIYPIVYKETGNNLAELYSIVNQKNGIICQFLKENGIEESEITYPAPKITDNQSNSYTSNATQRYVITAVVNVYTPKVQTILDVQAKLSQLMEQGIAIGSGNEWENPAIFEFEALNDIKPEMIEEANKNARQAAEQFAKDSDSKLGKIQNATQGLFSIEPRDLNTPHIKKIRVVTSATYKLK